MKTLVIAAIIGSLGVLPVYAFENIVQPQLDSLESMYSSMDETANDIANGKNVNETKTYKHAENISTGWKPAE